jgi:hypothetical protein
MNSPGFGVARRLLDVKWEFGFMTRSEACLWLAKRTGMAPANCRSGMPMKRSAGKRSSFLNLGHKRARNAPVIVFIVGSDPPQALQE